MTLTAATVGVNFFMVSLWYQLVTVQVSVETVDFSDGIGW